MTFPQGQVGALPVVKRPAGPPQVDLRVGSGSTGCSFGSPESKGGLRGMGRLRKAEHLGASGLGPALPQCDHGSRWEVGFTVERGEGGGVPRRGSKPMEGTDVWPVRAGHHGLVSGATPRRRPLCLDGPEALISVSAEELERDRAGAHVWSSDRAVTTADLHRSRLVGCRRAPWRGGDVEAHLGGFELPCAGRGGPGTGAGPAPASSSATSGWKRPW
jgi:hypothetical protein